MFGIFTIPSTAEAKDPFDISPVDFVQRIGAGWNLGKALENHTKAYSSVYEQETDFVKVETSQEMIDLVANAGFNAVRIPVSFTHQTVKTAAGNYVIKTEYLSRIKAVANMCFKNNMFVIINHSGDDREWLNISVSDEKCEEVKKQYQQTWQQVGEYFKDFDEKLIFEGGNEWVAERHFDGCGTGNDYCWWGCSQATFDRQNELYQIFVDTVRATGGNNDRRFLMLPTYGAQWYEHQISKLLIPNNDKHILIDIHWYNTGDQMKANIVDDYVSKWIKLAKEKGFGVVIGECGFYDNVSASTKENRANSFVKKVRGEYKIPMFLWDDGGDMKIMIRKPNTPPAWTTNGAPYVKAVIANSRQYIVGGVNCILGDVNDNGAFDAMDVLYLRKQLVKSIKTEFAAGADANVDGKVDMADLLKMRRVLANLERFNYK